MRRSRMIVAVPLLLVLVPLTSLGREDEKKGWLGVQIKAEEATSAIVIHEVVKDSPADKAGLKADDVILKIEKEAPGDLTEFVTKVGNFKPGEKITLQIRRDGKEQDIKVTLGERPAQP